MFRLTIEREKHGWSRAELGRRTSIHPADIGKFESGRLVPYPSHLKRIAEELAVPSDELLEEVK